MGKEKLLVTSNFSFSHNVFKSCLLLMRQNEYLWNKGLKSAKPLPCMLPLNSLRSEEAVLCSGGGSGLVTATVCCRLHASKCIIINVTESK